MTAKTVSHFVRGQSYNRRRDIHEPLGGSRQSGISPSRQSPFVFIFTGKGGKQHGYEDTWENGLFLYSGEGQKGDQTFKAGNKAIRDHAENGREVLLFTNLKKGVRFEGVFHYVGHQVRPGRDGDGNLRDLIVFHLKPEDGLADSPPDTEHAESSGPAPAASFGELRARAYAAAKPTIKRSSARESLHSYYERSTDIKDYVLRRSEGVCESCEKKAPFISRTGDFYLEAHHIHRLSDRGLDDPRHVAAICPNCHREIHYGTSGAALDNELLIKVQEKEVELAKNDGI